MVLSSLSGGDAQVDVAERVVTVLTRPGLDVLLPPLVRELDAAGVVAEDVAVRTPSLDDVFLTLTGEAAATPGRAA